RAPVIHFVTREGRKYLIDEGILEPEEIPDIPQIGPKNGSHVAHELQIRDARVWLHLVHRANPAHGGLERWQTGGSSIFPLNRSSAPYEVRPDAWFVYQLGRGVFVGFVEIDRGTEKSPRRWEEKFVSYALLMGSGLVQEYTGYQKGRVLITAPNYNRLVSIGAVLAPLISQYPHLQDRFWVTEHKNLSWASLYEPVWYIPGSPHFQPLVSR
ncbi:MAG: replication-relaxation family protein, partial [Armatimonadetes bacterium]|nr:replication-relaxation family protein [Armatimonadota bacterium]